MIDLTLTQQQIEENYIKFRDRMNTRSFGYVSHAVGR